MRITSKPSRVSFKLFSKAFTEVNSWPSPSEPERLSQKVPSREFALLCKLVPWKPPDIVLEPSSIIPKIFPSKWS